MLQTLVQSILKALSGMSCLAVILADAAALSGIYLGYNIVQSTQLKDPIMTAIFSSLLLAATFVDIFNQGLGLIFATCYEMKWMIRLYMTLMIMVLIIRCSVVFKPPVSGLKSAPFLGRPWSASNTPYDQMENDIIKFYGQSPSQARFSSLYTFETKLKCCGVSGPSDYSTKVAKPASCRSGEDDLPGVGVDGNMTGLGISMTDLGGATTNTSGRLAPDSAGGTTGGTMAPPETASDAGTGASSTAEGTNDSLSSGGDGGGGASTLATADRPGCRDRVWAVWEGSKIAFDTTVSAITFTMLTMLLTVAWCEFWGDGLLSGIEFCQPKKPAKRPKTTKSSKSAKKKAKRASR